MGQSQCSNVTKWGNILVHVRDVTLVFQIQPHLKKCFDNIKTLDMARMLNTMEATHMNSSEGEKVEFKAPVRLEGVVEVYIQYIHLRTHSNIVIYVHVLVKV